MTEANFPILSLVILLPILGAIAAGITRNVGLSKKIALLVATLELIATLVVVQWFDATRGDFQLVEQHAWIPSLNIQFLIGIDGISVLFLPMSALLTLVTIVASWNSVQHLTRFHFALLMAMEGATMGVFVALDLMLFFLFWELILPPIFFLIRPVGRRPRAPRSGDEIHAVHAIQRRAVIVCSHHAGGQSCYAIGRRHSPRFVFQFSRTVTNACIRETCKS